MWHFGKDALTSYSYKKFYDLWGQLERLSSYLFKRVWKENKDKKKSPGIPKQATGECIHGQARIK